MQLFISVVASFASALHPRLEHQFLMVCPGSSSDRASSVLLLWLSACKASKCCSLGESLWHCDTLIAAQKQPGSCRSPCRIAARLLPQWELKKWTMLCLLMLYQGLEASKPAERAMIRMNSHFRLEPTWCSSWGGQRSRRVTSYAHWHPLQASKMRLTCRLHFS